MDCRWNDWLRDETADAFCAAVESFCARGILVHDWVRFVPQLHMEGFWEPLRLRILHGLRLRKVLQTWQSEILCFPHQVRIVPGRFLHDGSPLFDDISSSELYLSPKYPEESIALLESLGVVSLSWEEFLKRVELDTSSSIGKLKATPLLDPWHDIVARALLPLLTDPQLRQYQARTMALRVIPITGGIWNNSFQSSYMPKFEEVDVPTDLGFNIVNPHATRSSDRVDFFRAMGVGDCEARTIITKIFRLHKFVKPNSLHNSLTHLRYLYWVWDKYRMKGQELYSKLWIFTDARNLQRPVDGVYFNSDEEYSTAWLLKPESDKATTTPTCRDAYFLHDKFLNPRYTNRPGASHTWKQWLENIIGLRYYPPLMDASTGKDLSPVLRHILSISSSKFLHTVRKWWALEYHHTFVSSSSAQQALRETQVLCNDGEFHAIGRTYLPTKPILDQLDRLGLSCQLPVLNLGDEMQPIDADPWDFLQKCGAVADLNVDFHLLALRKCRTLKWTDAQSLISSTQKIYHWLGINATQKDSDLIL